MEIQFNNLELLLLIIICIVSALVASSWPFHRNNYRHKRNINSADRVLSKLLLITCPMKQFSYLRKVDPFVFEEMILTSIKRNNHQITRNKRYTGDGGIDGRAVINGVETIIQAKRYSSYIAAKDVEVFSSKCETLGSKGLFVHTGRTGKKARGLRHSNVDIVSGNRMLDLLTGNQFKPRYDDV